MVLSFSAAPGGVFHCRKRPTPVRAAGVVEQEKASPARFCLPFPGLPAFGGITSGAAFRLIMQ